MPVILLQITNSQAKNCGAGGIGNVKDKNRHSRLLVFPSLIPRDEARVSSGRCFISSEWNCNRLKHFPRFEMVTASRSVDYTPASGEKRRVRFFNDVNPNKRNT